jgi:hypothetical protein
VCVSVRQVPADEWTHVAVVQSQASTRLYVDGKLDGEMKLPRCAFMQTTPWLGRGVGVAIARSGGAILQSVTWLECAWRLVLRLAMAVCVCWPRRHMLRPGRPRFKTVIKVIESPHPYNDNMDEYWCVGPMCLHCTAYGTHLLAACMRAKALTHKLVPLCV